MPRENRKRGKRHRKTEEQPQEEVQAVQQPEEPEAGPSWIVQKQDAQADIEAPFGYLDTDVKAYFRSVDVQMRQWQDGTVEVDEDEKRAFFMAALTEMNEKEKQLATDPDCSVILERVVHSMDDFARRVFADRLAGSYEILSKHRFASHVIQTLITLGAETVSRETTGSLPKDCPPELPTMTQIILEVADDMTPSIPVLLNDPFASHIIRALLSVLAGLPLNLSSASQSKKSKKWKDRQGEMKSVFEEDRAAVQLKFPSTFGEKASVIIRTTQQSMSANEVRACAASKVACPTLDVLITVEAERGLSNVTGSLMDMVTSGLVEETLNGESTDSEPSAYIATLLKDTTSSHLLETILARAPAAVFNRIWAQYLCPNGDPSKIAVHPVSNFVFAKAVARASAEQLEVVGQKWWNRAVKAGRLGVIKAIVDRAVELGNGAAAEGLWTGVKEAFEVTPETSDEDTINTIMRLKTLPDYLASEQSEPNVQGALLLQAIVRLPDPHNKALLDAILGLPIPTLTKLAHHPVSSRLLDALLDSSAVPHGAKRRFVLLWIDHYAELVDDRIGSRVGERCWKWCDTYTKEKIARSVMHQEQQLAASYFGKYFARALHLYVLRTKPAEWRDMMGKARKEELERQQGVEKAAKPVDATATAPATAEPPVEKKKSKKRKAEKDSDEIDSLFKKARKMQKGALETLVPEQDGGEQVAMDVDSRVLAAIKSAPAGHSGKKKKPRH
ncbi:ARM repeat-containing protein [Cylindrobasidium torrendii FP15055 ss-10]|uniref:Nucleolar protein 9 n=1 Tax=Cylindrobasidium torrendii FP15055 ss-10 TaxID=1314674 RepID=A0A0D7AUF6_9AGAR|nr:ARM repeat-containing protein [Cylindrobasidium torrendii FP15055 ss-10]